MNKCPPQSIRPALSEQMRQPLIDTLKTHLPLDIHAYTLDETQLWELVMYASVQGNQSGQCLPGIGRGALW